MRKIVLISTILVAGAMALYFSFYTEALSEKQTRERLKEFQPGQLVDYYWDNYMDELIGQAICLDEFLPVLLDNPEDAAAKFGRVLGIGSNTFFIVKLQARIVSLDDQRMYLLLSDQLKATLPLTHIYSNLARDASGWFSVDDFTNTLDFNALSAYMNKKIQEEVLAAQASQLKIGSEVCLIAAVEVDLDELALTELELIPYKLVVLE